MTRAVTVSTALDAPADVVWRAVATPQAFVHVAGSMLRFPAAERLEHPWQAGDTLEGWVFLGGIIPFSWHRLTVAAVDHEARRLRSEEGGGLIRTWNHDIEVDAVGEDRCRYVDRIVIDAGVITPVVAGFAQVFYRYRQRRWRELARLLAATCRSA